MSDPKKAQWSMREVLDPGTPVSAITSGAGRIMIAGMGIYRVLKPTGWGLEHRSVPAGLEMPLSIAIEPRSPHRVAIGPVAGDVALFTDTPNSSSITLHPFTDPRGTKDAVQLAWVVNNDRSSLFARADDGTVYRMQSEGWGMLEMPPVRAIAQDANGGIAALTIVDGRPKVYMTSDGGTSWSVRSLGVDVEADPQAPASLALAGTTVAVMVGGMDGPMVSLLGERRTVCHVDLDRTYAMAFEGSDPNARLYVAQQHVDAEVAAISLLHAQSDWERVMEFRCEDDDPLDLGPIAWDETRHGLLIASRGGLLAMSPLKRATRKPRARKAAPETLQ